ncbi:thiamine phosphate synthase [Oceanihabitans sp. 2_MG-2023]|uniref:thiamine phosphate synthase n=1 Tax=Oceanihabitans sp. 2_MG-2023 TaxID=3062661 RepID=UPI0026E1BF61|nr:thiamine phosphate synthase [Oceanihabitans sp. 2_MG-2023]MDO6596650.1 thiamine phosphate synthase [Oceanihabitans sp. 2_MG-2023]
MIIPKLHYISQGESPKELLENIQKACTSGAELVQLRIENASEKKVLKIAKEAIKITSHFQTRLIIFEYFKVAKEIKADGIHIEKIDSFTSIARKQLYPWQIIGATANTLQDCEKLIAKEVDYITLSPFKAVEMQSKHSSALGLNGFLAITEALKTETPILGFGEITTNDVADILKTGISGIAVSNAITQNFDSIKTFHQLLNASATQEQRHTFK